MKLLVISDAPILTISGKKDAYAPYVREMDLWMQHIDEVTYVCPTRYTRKLLTQPFKNQEFEVKSLRRLEFHNLISAFISLLTIPYQMVVLWNAMRKADHIHLRCPGNLALLASLVQITLPRKRKTAKYAGNFSPNASQPLAYRWQKKLLSNPSWTKNIDVLAYGEWPDQSKNIKPFFTATYSEQDKGSFTKEFKEPYQFIFVGTLSSNKNPQFLVQLVHHLNSDGIPAQAHFYGDGPMMEVLKVQSSEFRVQSENLPSERSLRKEKVSLLGKCSQDKGAFYFHGNQPKEIIQEAYKKAHFSFLASQSEGWPKAVAESMWYGCIPIATPVSCVPWMLGISNSKSQLPNLNHSTRPEALEDQFFNSTSELKGKNINPNQKTRSEALEDRFSNSKSQSNSSSSESRERTTDISNSQETYPLGLEKGFYLKELGSRGIIFSNVEQTNKALKELFKEPILMNNMSQNAQEWSQEYTMEKFESEIIKLLQS